MNVDDPPEFQHIGTTAVLKFGGEIVADRPALMAVLGEVAALVARGWRFVICHGGGPQAGALQDRLGLKVVKVGGQRVTDAATLQIMKCVLAGEVSVDVAAAAAAVGLQAVGLSGVSASLVRASRRPPAVVSGGGAERVDFGFVGDVDGINVHLLTHLWSGGYTPVVSTLGVDSRTHASEPCQVFNINADTVASVVASALRADHLFLMTDVPGVLRDRNDASTRIPRLFASQAREAIANHVIVGGMIPKVEEALRHLSSSTGSKGTIGAVHILGAMPGALEGAARSPGEVGTVLLPDVARDSSTSDRDERTSIV